LEEFREWVEHVRSLPEGDRTITVDVECAGPHLVCVGMMLVKGMRGLCVRLRGDLGVQVWQPEELREVLSLLFDVLSDPEIPKWFHNGQSFDIPYLEFQGFTIGGYAGDSLLMQRYMFPGMNAGLQGCGVFYAGVPAWKQLSNETNDDEKGDGK
jgi:hypothetical protein